MDKEVKEVLQSQVIALKEGKMEASLQCLSPLVQPAPRYESSSDRVHLPATMHSVMAETTNDVRILEITFENQSFIIYLLYFDKTNNLSLWSCNSEVS